MGRRTFIVLMIVFVFICCNACSKEGYANTEKTEESTEQKVEQVSFLDEPLPEENSRKRTTDITHIVLHFSSNVLEKPNDPYDVKAIRNIFIENGVSAHYVIGREGDIYRLVSEDRVAFHAGKGNLLVFPQYKDRLNDYSIGIELMAIGTKEEMDSMMTDTFYADIDPAHIGYTDAQYESLNLLLTDIMARYPSIKNDREHIVGHDEYAPDRKSDPGSMFNWSEVGL